MYNFVVSSDDLHHLELFRDLLTQHFYFKNCVIDLSKICEVSNV